MGKVEESGDSSIEEEGFSSSEESKNAKKANGDAKISIGKSPAADNGKKKSAGNIDDSLLTDAQLNIELVKLRKTLKTIKTQTIQSIIRKVQVLKSPKEAAKPKSKEKADNQLALLEAVKRLNVDETVKFAFITDEKECNTIISTEFAAKKYIAMARIANTTVVREKIKSLAEKYQNWDEMVTKFYPGAKSAKRKAKRIKILQALRKKEKSGKTSKAASPKKNKKEPSGETGDNNIDEKGINEATEKKAKKKSVPVPIEKDEESESKKETKTEKLSSSPKPKDTPEKKAVSKQKPESPSKIQEKKSPGKQSDKTTEKDSSTKKSKFHNAEIVETTIKTAVVKKLQKLEELAELENPKKFVANKDATKASKKDSFFLSSDGQEMSSEEEVDDDASESEEEFQDKSYTSRKYHIRSKEDARNGKSAENNRNSKFQERATPKRNKGFVEKQKPKRKEFVKPQPAFPQEPEKLHPSWEAKRKLSAIKIDSVPANKKIKFD